MGLRRLVGNAIHRFRYKTLREEESHREDMNVSLIDNAYISYYCILHISCWLISGAITMYQLVPINILVNSQVNSPVNQLIF